MNSDSGILVRLWVKGRLGGRLGAALVILATLPMGVTGCGITVNEPLYGNYNKSETTRLRRRSDIRECERRHQRFSGGPANRKAGVTQLRVEQCLEVQGYQRQPSGR